LAAKKKYKNLTKAEKKLNKEVRDDLRQRGILPPVKPKLNRKRFAKEVLEEFKESKTFSDIEYLLEAIRWMLTCIESDTEFRKISPEQIGVLKTIKMAAEIKKYMEGKKAAGEKNYELYELYKEVVEPIVRL
jgi:hypothetical protein